MSVSRLCNFRRQKRDQERNREGSIYKCLTKEMQRMGNAKNENDTNNNGSRNRPPQNHSVTYLNNIPGKLEF
jgi:hypothetical protein